MESLDRYQIYTSYVSPNVIGQTESNIDGVTYSMPVYSEPYYVASCPELSLYATGSLRQDAIDNLNGMTASIKGFDYPIDDIKTW